MLKDSLSTAAAVSGVHKKHFACNNQEHDRFTVDVRVGERTLDDKVRRILYVAAQLGAFDHRYKDQVGALDRSPGRPG